MTSIRCPYCNHHIHLVRGTRAGKFYPRCSRCQKKYILVLPPQPDQPPFVSKVEIGSDPGDTVTPDIANALGIDDADFHPPKPLDQLDEDDEVPNS